MGIISKFIFISILVFNSISVAFEDRCSEYLRLASYGEDWVPVIVRKAKPADEDAILAIDKLSYPYPMTPGEISRIVNKYKTDILVAEEANSQKVIGWALVQRVKQGTWIHTLAIDPKYRRKKVATQIVDTVVDEYVRRSEEPKNLFLSSQDDQLAAAEFIKARGFKEQMRTAGEHGSEIVLYTWILGPELNETLSPVEETAKQFDRFPPALVELLFPDASLGKKSSSGS